MYCSKGFDTPSETTSTSETSGPKIANWLSWLLSWFSHTRKNSAVKIDSEVFAAIGLNAVKATGVLVLTRSALVKVTPVAVCVAVFPKNAGSGLSIAMFKLN